MTLLLSNEDVEKVLTMEVCLEALETLYREVGEERAVSTPRMDVHLPTLRSQGTDVPMAHYLKTMSGGTPSFGVAALRLTSDIVAWKKVGDLIRREKLPALPGNRWLGLVLLFSSSNGELLAIMNDGVLQRMRVGGTNGLGVKYLARPDCRSAGLFGSGWQAGSQLMALCAVRPMEKIKVYSPTREHREAFAGEMSEKLHVEVIPVDSPDEAARNVDLIITATNSRQPFLKGLWLKPGIHLSCMQRDEAEDDAYEKSDVLVIHTHAMEHNFVSRDLVERHDREGFEVRDHPIPRKIDWARLPTLGDLVARRIQGRTSDEQITCFVNNIGLGAQFAAVGARVYERARAQGLGRELPIDWFVESVHP